MGKKLKKEIKNLHIKVNGGVSDGLRIIPKQLEVIITNDSVGKSLSIHDNERMFTIPFEPIEKYFK